jgi:PadR family transcriptional regulator, regulatory protein PadR
MALLKGTLDVLVLKALSWGPMHGFEIVTWLEDRSDGHLAIGDAALLQALHRMEERKFITAEWGVTRNERRARYYSMTAMGRAHLRAESQALAEHARVLTTILATRRPAG